MSEAGGPIGQAFDRSSRYLHKCFSPAGVAISARISNSPHPEKSSANLCSLSVTVHIGSGEVGGNVYSIFVICSTKERSPSTKTHHSYQSCSYLRSVDME